MKTTSSIKSFGGIDDYFGVLLITTNEVVYYNRSPRVSCGQIFDTKDQMIIEVGIKFLEEGIEQERRGLAKAGTGSYAFEMVMTGV